MQEELVVSYWGKNGALNTGKLPAGGLPRNSVVKVTDRPNMTSAVYRGCKALNQTKKQSEHCF